MQMSSLTSNQEMNILTSLCHGLHDSRYLRDQKHIYINTDNHSAYLIRG